MAQLSSERITAAALTILRDYGLADLSVRKVAGSLNVQPGALYWHFPHKQALLGAVSHYVVAAPLDALEPLPGTVTPTAQLWREYCDQLEEAPSSPHEELVKAVLDLRNRTLRYPDGAELVSASFAADTIVLPQLAVVEGCVKHWGTPYPDGAYQDSARAIILMALGATVDEQARLQLAAVAPSPSPAGDDAPSPNSAHQRPYQPLLTGLQLVVRGLASI